MDSTEYYVMTGSSHQNLMLLIFAQKLRHFQCLLSLFNKKHIWIHIYRSTVQLTFIQTLPDNNNQYSNVITRVWILKAFTFFFLLL